MAVFFLVVKGTNELIKAIGTPSCAQARKIGCVQNHSLSVIQCTLFTSLHFQ